MASKSLEQLLKSSLPLEQYVAEIAFKAGLISCGEFPYLRRTEVGAEAEFSVDVLATASYVPKLGTDTSIELNALIECKYASASVDWIFSTTPKHGPLFYSSVSVFHWLGTHLLENLGQINKLEATDYCTKGISLSPSSADPKQIRHGLQQLRHAMPHLLDRITTLYTSNYDEHPIPIIAPMLVTNAPIRLMNQGLNLSDIEKADSIDDITQLKDMICCYQPAGPELLDICQVVAEKISTKYAVANRQYSSTNVFEDLVASVESIPVVSLGRLGSYLADIRCALSGMTAISHQDFRKSYIALGDPNES